MLRSTLWLCALAALSAAQEPIAPHSAIEPPAAKDAASLTASTKASPPDLLTTGEKTGWTLTAPYAEAVDISHRLERASSLVKVLNIGATPEGRTMIALVVSKDRAFTPEAAARTNKTRRRVGLARPRYCQQRRRLPGLQHFRRHRNSRLRLEQSGWLALELERQSFRPHSRWSQARWWPAAWERCREQRGQARA